MPHSMWDLSFLTGIKSRPKHWQLGVLTTEPPGKYPQFLYSKEWEIGLINHEETQLKLALVKYIPALNCDVGSTFL